MTARPGLIRRPLATMAVVVVVGLYLAVMGAEPFLHHSDACHATTPWHCTACALQMTSPGVETDTLLQAITFLPDAGKLLPDTLPHDVAPLISSANDRSPPHVV